MICRPLSRSQRIVLTPLSEFQRGGSIEAHLWFNRSIIWLLARAFVLMIIHPFWTKQKKFPGNSSNKISRDQSNLLQRKAKTRNKKENLKFKICMKKNVELKKIIWKSQILTWVKKEILQILKIRNKTKIQDTDLWVIIKISKDFQKKWFKHKNFSLCKGIILKHN